MMNKEREIEILQYKISEIEEKISILQKNNVSDKKIFNLELKRLQYEDKLSEIEV